MLNLTRDLMMNICLEFSIKLSFLSVGGTLTHLVIICRMFGSDYGVKGLILRGNVFIKCQLIIISLMYRFII